MTTVHGLLEERRSDVPAIVAEERSITYAELADAVDARAGELGTGPGDRVGLVGPNGIDWAIQAYAVVRTGATLVPLSTLLRPPELAAQLRIAEVSRLLGADAPVDLAPPGAGREDDFCVLFTSGSTGAPKGTIHTHRSALGAVAAGLEARGVREGERLYIPMPFFWTGGLAGGLLSTLLAGATLLAEVRPTRQFLERERVTLFRGWPHQAEAFADADLPELTDFSLPAVLPHPPAPGARPNLFGMTETFGPWCGAPLDRDLPRGKWGSCGRPFEGTEVQVVDGELWLRGPHLMRGICGRDDVFEPGGWYRTGDRGRVDEDGYVWFDGRLDDMFKVKGATVYPSEVEAALRSLDEVRQAHVTDVDGQVGALVVSDAAQEDVRLAVKERLSSFKVPTRWRVTADAGEVPMTPTGKVDKAALRARLEGSG